MFREEVRMQVLRPGFEPYTVWAHCPLDARLQAAAHWDIPAPMAMEYQVAVEKKALKGKDGIK